MLFIVFNAKSLGIATNLPDWPRLIQTDGMQSDAAAASETRERKLGIAMWLNLVLVVGQIVFGIIAHSLGLIADAGHNLTDVAAVLASLVAVRLARRAATHHRSFGYHRATVLAAQANAASILVVTAWVIYEAIRRLSDTSPVNGRIVIVVALLAAAVNLTATLVLRESHDHHGHSHDHSGHDATGSDLNMRSAVLHMAGDAVASLGVALAGLVIVLTGGWYWLDPAVSIAIGLLIAWQAWKLLREAVDVLLESTPRGLDVDAMKSVITGVPGIEEVHDLHVWSLASDVRAMSAHIVLDGHPTLEEAQAVGTRAKAAISGAFSIAHATFELECESCRDDGSWCAFTGEHSHR
jgi:cobalt-zinc-cadmium efflux system protein